MLFDDPRARRWGRAVRFPVSQLVQFAIVVVSFSLFVGCRDRQRMRERAPAKTVNEQAEGEGHGEGETATDDERSGEADHGARSGDENDDASHAAAVVLGAPPLCEASAAIRAPWDPGRVLVADNEQHDVLFELRLEGGGATTEAADTDGHPSRAVDMREIEMPSKRRPRDIEALADLGDGRILIVGSHSRRKNCRDAPRKRRRLRVVELATPSDRPGAPTTDGDGNSRSAPIDVSAFREISAIDDDPLEEALQRVDTCLAALFLDDDTRRAGDDAASSDVEGESKSGLASDFDSKIDVDSKIDPGTRATLCRRLVEADQTATAERCTALNIEGAFADAAVVDDANERRVWLGLRAPLAPQGRAWVLGTPLERVVAGAAPLRFDAVRALDLAGHGVRELLLVDRTVWILSGPAVDPKADEDASHALWRMDVTTWLAGPWERSDEGDAPILRPERVATLPPSTEGLVVLDERRVLVFIDGDQGDEPEQKCGEPARQLVVGGGRREAGGGRRR